MRKNNVLIRFLSLLCCFTLVCSLISVVTVSANSVYFDLKSLGVINGFEFEKNENDYVQRDEFAQLLVNMMNQEDVALSLENVNHFSDISDSPYKGAINLLYEMKIISGSNGAFEPDRYVRYTEACKMFVNALGYNAIVSGNDLNSYVFMAGSIGVSNNVDSSLEYMTYKNTAIMLNNALDIGKMVPMYYNTNIGPSYEVQDDNTYRNNIVNSVNNGYVKMRGVVTADVSAYLFTQRNNMKETQIEIDGMLFDYNGVAPIGLVGMEVEFFVTTVSGEYDKIVSMVLTEKNTVVEITEEDIVTLNKTGLSYYYKDSKRDDVNFNNETKFIYNNHIESNLNFELLNMNNVITVRTIDNDEDEYADVVFVFEYLDGIASEVYEDNKSVVLEKEVNGVKTLLLGDEDTDAYVEYYDSEGNKGDFSLIKPDSVLSIASSKDNYNIRIVVSNKKIEGYIETVDGPYVTISGIEYKAKPEVSNIHIGQNVEVLLNYQGDIVDCKEINASTDYAYIYQVQNAKNGFGTTKVKLLIPNTVSTETVEGAYNEETNTTSSSTNLYVNNSKTLIYPLANKVRLDNVMYSADKVSDYIYHKAMRFYLNNNGEIVKFESLKPLYEYTSDGTTVKSETVQQRMYYSSNERVFGTGACKPFGIDDSTYAVCVPVVNSVNDYTVVDLSDDELLNFRMELMNSTIQTVSGYEVDEDSHVSEFIVLLQTASAMKVGEKGVLTAAKKWVGLVTKAAYVYDKDTDETYMRFTMLTIGEEKKLSEQTFVVSNLINDTSVFNGINKGDLVLYSLDSFDRLNNIKKLNDSEDYETDRTYKEGTDEESYCYLVKDINFDEIDGQKRRWVDVIELCSSDDRENTVQTFNIPHNTNLAPIVFIMDDADNVSVANIKDIRVNDRVYVYKPASVNEVTAIVIKR